MGRGTGVNRVRRKTFLPTMDGRPRVKVRGRDWRWIQQRCDEIIVFAQKRPWLGEFFYPSEAMNIYENIKQLAMADSRAKRIGYMGCFRHEMFKHWHMHLEHGGLIWRS